MTDSIIDIQYLAGRQAPGFSLEQSFYLSNDIFKHDIEQVLSRQWHYVAHISDVPNPGDYLSYEIGDESIVIVRDKHDTLHAHFNVCRHRGSRICLESSGNVKRLVCPYHAWVYSLDGKLQLAKQMADDFKAEEHSLHSCQLEVFEGLIFINLSSNDASDFQNLKNNISSFVIPHGLPDAKVAHTRKYTINANWKLVVENFRECYHCSPSHPEYSSVNAYVRAGDHELGSYKPIVDEWAEKYIQSGRETGFKNFPYPLQPHHAWRMPIRDGFKTATKDGTPAAPLMGDFKEYDNAETAVFFSPLSYFYLNDDYATTFCVTPKSSTLTEVTVSWLVNADAQEGVDYDIEKLVWMWDRTTIQDGKIVADNHKGVKSSKYTPGPYSEREYGTADFTSWYLAQLQGKPEARVVFRK